MVGQVSSIASQLLRNQSRTGRGIGVSRALSAIILKYLENNKHVPAAEVIEMDIYVGNILSGFKNEADLLNYFKESIILMFIAGMNLRA